MKSYTTHVLRTTIQKILVILKEHMEYVKMHTKANHSYKSKYKTTDSKELLFSVRSYPGPLDWYDLNLTKRNFFAHGQITDIRLPNPIQRIRDRVIFLRKTDMSRKEGKYIRCGDTNIIMGDPHSLYPPSPRQIDPQPQQH
jgi:hypothetical protein